MSQNEANKNHNIKQFKPKKNGRYKQGYIDPSSCHKLFESQRHSPIIYRSSWEKTFVRWLEREPRVRRWGSECLKIDYVDPTDGQKHHYYPDYVVEMASGNVYVVEVKPKSQTEPPVDPHPASPNYNTTSYCPWEMRTWIRNQAKWKAAMEFCASHNMTFKIMTEESISRM